MEKSYESDTTGLLYMVVKRDGKNYEFDLIVPLVDIEFFVSEKLNVSKLVLGMDFEIDQIDIGDELIVARYSMTNDPTCINADSVRSLGYYGYNVGIANCKLISKTPLTFESNKNGLIINKMHMPMRRLLL